MPTIGHLLLIIKLLLLSAVAFLPAQEQQRTPEYAARVRLVEVTLQAKGPSRRHLTDLRAEELILTAGGRERDIRIFQPVQIGLERFGELNAVGVEYQPVPEEVKRYPPRYFVLLFHQIQFRFGGFQKAKEATMEFVRERMLPNDYVSVVGFDKFVDFELDFTNDKGEVLAALEGMHLKHRNIAMGDGFYAYLQELSARLARMPHKVSIILIAEGMQGIGGPVKYAVYDRTIQTLQAADVRIFGVDAGGLNLRDPGATIARFTPALAALVPQSFNLGLWSQPTGGRFYRYNNDIAALLEQVDYEMSAYYVLGFYLDEDEEVEKQIAIKIRCSRPGVRLLYKERFLKILRTEDQSDNHEGLGSGSRGFNS